MAPRKFRTRTARGTGVPATKDIKVNGGKRLPNERAEELMAVSLDLFAKRDFSAVTIKDIATAAQVNTALIYYYFENKEDLFRATIAFATRQALGNYRQLRERHEEPVDLIADWFDNNLELSEPLRKLVKIMLDYSSASPRLASIDRLIAEFYREEVNILSTGIREGIARGIFEAVDAEQLALFASVHLDGIMAASLIRKDFDLQGAIGHLKRQFWARLGYDDRNGLPKAPPRRSRPIQIARRT